MIKRLRIKYSDKQLKEIYSTPHNSDNWQDHIERIDKSIDFINKNYKDIDSAADLSCGNGKILNSINASKKYYGDFAKGYKYHGPIEKTILEIPQVDLFICSETMEHLDNPIEVLRKIRKKTKNLFISTPCGKFDDDNKEHYWAWDLEGIKEILNKSNFTIEDSDILVMSDRHYYDFALVYCS